MQGRNPSRGTQSSEPVVALEVLASTRRAWTKSSAVEKPGLRVKPQNKIRNTTTAISRGRCIPTPTFIRSSTRQGLGQTPASSHHPKRRKSQHRQQGPSSHGGYLMVMANHWEKIWLRYMVSFGPFPFIALAPDAPLGTVYINCPRPVGRDPLNRSPLESALWTWTARTMTTSQVADRSSLGDLTNMRTLESDDRPTYPVSSYTSQVARATLPYSKTEASFSVQGDVRDHFSGGADPFNMSGGSSDTGILRRTTTTISGSSRSTSDELLVHRISASLLEPIKAQNVPTSARMA